MMEVISIEDRTGKEERELLEAAEQYELAKEAYEAALKRYQIALERIQKYL